MEARRGLSMLPKSPNARPGICHYTDRLRCSALGSQVQEFRSLQNSSVGCLFIYPVFGIQGRKWSLLGVRAERRYPPYPTRSWEYGTSDDKRWENRAQNSTISDDPMILSISVWELRGVAISDEIRAGKEAIDRRSRGRSHQRSESDRRACPVRPGNSDVDTPSTRGIDVE